MSVYGKFLAPVAAYALYIKPHKTSNANKLNRETIKKHTVASKTHTQLSARDYMYIYSVSSELCLLFFHIAPSLWCLCDTTTPSWRVNTR